MTVVRDTSDLMAALRVGEGFDIDALDAHDPRERFGWDKETGKAELQLHIAALEELQKQLFAERERSVLIVLQGMDASGKGGAVRTVLAPLNPAGVTVHPFGVPTSQELARDYLWRIHRHTPAAGTISVFDRSHYEDVLVVRVKSLVPEKQWRRRYGHIRDFERLLTDEGTTVLKFFMNVSSEKQRQRLQDRIDSPDERWKFDAGDLDDRKLWPEYRAAYADALAETSTEYAPWFVVPTDRKWVRDLVVARILRDALEQLDPQYPEPVEDISHYVVV